MAVGVHARWLRPWALALARRHAEEVEGFAQREAIPEARGSTMSAWESLERRTRAFEAEIATALFTGLPWRPHVGRGGGDLPDVGRDIDVKWSSRRELYASPAALRRHAEWRYVAARGRPPDLWLVGWLYGDELLERDTTTFGNGRDPVHAAEPDTLRDIFTLEPPTFQRVTRAGEPVDRWTFDLRGYAE